MFLGIIDDVIVVVHDVRATDIAYQQDYLVRGRSRLTKFTNNDSLSAQIVSLNGL